MNKEFKDYNAKSIVHMLLAFFLGGGILFAGVVGINGWQSFPFANQHPGITMILGGGIFMYFMYKSLKTPL